MTVKGENIARQPFIHTFPFFDLRGPIAQFLTLEMVFQMLWSLDNQKSLQLILISAINYQLRRQLWYGERTHRPWESHSVSSQVFALPLHSCKAWVRQLTSADPQFPHVQMRMVNPMYVTKLL